MLFWQWRGKWHEKTENTFTVIYVLLHWNDFNILNLSHITSRLTIQVRTVWFNLKIVLIFLNFFDLVLKFSYDFCQSSTTYLYTTFLSKKRVLPMYTLHILKRTSTNMAQCIRNYWCHSKRTSHKNWYFWHPSPPHVTICHLWSWNTFPFVTPCTK